MNNLPEIHFQNKEEYIIKRDLMYENIKKTIDEWVVTDTFEYEHMDYQGLTSRQKINIGYTLIEELKKFTNNMYNDWCDEIVFYIIHGLKGFLDGLVKINKITNFTAEELSILIYNSIIYQLDNDEHSPTILEDIVKFPEISDSE